MASHTSLKMDTLPIIVDVLNSRNARSILDIGCGRGGLAATLTRRGFSVTGIEPQPEIVNAAKEKVPTALFDVGHAENLPYLNGSFDVVVFLNSLHHVAPGKMELALGEACRVVRENGSVVIVEPEAKGISSKSCARSKMKLRFEF